MVTKEEINKALNVLKIIIGEKCLNCKEQESCVEKCRIHIAYDDVKHDLAMMLLKLSSGSLYGKLALEDSLE